MTTESTLHQTYRSRAVRRSGRYFLCALLALAAPTLLRAQAVRLTGVVLEAGSNRPIPFATIEMPTRQVGVQATEAGAFVLELPAALTAADSLRVASIGFVPRRVAVPTTSPCQLELRALPVPLAEVVVHGKLAPVVRLGSGDDGDRYGFGNGKISAMGSSGWQIARQFLDCPAGYIQAVRFFLKPNSQCGKQASRAPFRVRLYAADGPNGSPGTDLLTTSLLTAATKMGWHEVDVSKFQLRVPVGGFFVAMEWLYTNAEFGCEYKSTMMATNEKKTSYSYGQSLGGYLDDSPKQTWNLMAGRPWRLFNITLPQYGKGLGNQNAAIQAVIQPD